MVFGVTNDIVARPIAVELSSRTAVSDGLLGRTFVHTALVDAPVTNVLVTYRKAVFPRSGSSVAISNVLFDVLALFVICHAAVPLCSSQRAFTEAPVLRQCAKHFESAARTGG